MPTYDYKCAKCHQSFAVEQSILDAPLKKCKKCGGRIEKLLPKNINLIFRGSGFYATDYKRTGRRQDSKKPKDGEKGGTE